mgnify:CR=1 FL=1
MKDDIQTGKCGCCHVKNPDTVGFAEAVEKANNWRAEMKYGEWTIRVWHNIHWCWTLKGFNGQLDLHYNEHTEKFSTLFSPNGYDTGTKSGVLAQPVYDKDPNEVVRRQLVRMKEVLSTRIERDSVILAQVYKYV